MPQQVFNPRQSVCNVENSHCQSGILGNCALNNGWSQNKFRYTDYFSFQGKEFYYKVFFLSIEKNPWSVNKPWGVIWTNDTAWKELKQQNFISEV